MQSIVGVSVSSNAMGVQAHAERLAWCGGAGLMVRPKSRWFSWGMASFLEGKRGLYFPPPLGFGLPPLGYAENFILRVNQSMVVFVNIFHAL